MLEWYQREAYEVCDPFHPEIKWTLNTKGSKYWVAKPEELSQIDMHWHHEVLYWWPESGEWKKVVRQHRRDVNVYVAYEFDERDAAEWMFFNEIKLPPELEKYVREFTSFPDSPPETEPTEPNKTSKKPYTATQRLILETLDGQAMTGPELRKEIRRGRTTIYDNMKRLQKEGLVKYDRKLGGYYCPDAPPK